MRHATNKGRSCQRPIPKSDEELLVEGDSFKSILKENIISSLDDTVAVELTHVQQEIEQKQEQMIILNRDKRSGSIRESEYLERGSKLGEEIDTLQDRLNELQAKTDSNRLAKHRIEDILKVLETSTADKFDDDMFKTLVARLIQKSATEVEFEFKCGIKLRAKQD